MHTMRGRARLHPVAANQQPTCAAKEACTKPAKFWPNSDLCLYHRQRMYRYGTTMKLMPRDADLARHRADIRRTLRLHRDSPPVQWALNVVARELFDYRATYDFSHEHFTQARLQTLKAREVAPIDFLQRYVECFSVHADGWNFETPRAYHSWVARKLMGLADGSMKGVNTNAKHMAAVGLTAHEALCGFAIATLQRVERDNAVRSKASKALEEWAMN